MKDDEEKMDQLEEEVRQEQGIDEIGPDMTTEEAGKLGGNMTKKLVEERKESKAEEEKG